MDCSPPGSSVYVISQARILSGLPFPPPGDLPNSGIECISPASPALAGGFFTAKPPRSLNSQERLFLNATLVLCSQMIQKSYAFEGVEFFIHDTFWH